MPVVFRDYRMGMAYASLPVFGAGGTHHAFQSLRTISELPLPDTLQEGDQVKVTGRVCVTNTDVRVKRGAGINWNVRIRIEPGSGEDWAPNQPPDNNDEQGNFAVVGYFGTKINGNLSAARHHECRELSTTWFARGDLTAPLYAKLVTRANSGRAQPGDQYFIDYSEIEVEIVRGIETFPAEAEDLAYLDSWTSDAAQSSYTFTMDIGSPDPDRKIIIPVGGRHTVSGRTISSVTVDGQPATALVTQINAGNGTDIAAIYGIAKPTGASAEIIVTFSGSMSRMGVHTYRRVGDLEPRDTFATTVIGAKNNRYGIVKTNERSAVLAFATGRFDYDWGSRSADFDTGNIFGGYGQGAVSWTDAPAPNAVAVNTQPDGLGNPIFIVVSW